MFQIAYSFEGIKGDAAFERAYVGTIDEARILATETCCRFVGFPEVGICGCGNGHYTVWHGGIFQGGFIITGPFD